jgi:hypothetical protein
MSHDTYALLWSKKANSFHIEPLEQTAKSGMRHFRQEGSNDYLLIAFGSWDEMSTQARELRPVVLEREHVRHLQGAWG